MLFPEQEKVNSSNKPFYCFVFHPLDLCSCSVIMMILHVNLLCCSVSARVRIQVIVCTIFACVWAGYVSVSSKNESGSLKP